VDRRRGADLTLVTSARARRRCPVCGAEHAACGGPTNHQPVDLPRRAEMSKEPVQRYLVMVDGVERLMLLSPADA
jgi:hypothetical protein